MKRREFFSITGLANLTGVWRRSRQPQIGFLTADMYGAQGIKKITLDGREVERVFELDDVEGWVRFYDATGRICRKTGEIEVHTQTGEVEVFWEDIDKIPIHWRDDKCRSRDARRIAKRDSSSGRLESASLDPPEDLEPLGRGEPSSDLRAYEGGEPDEGRPHQPGHPPGALGDPSLGSSHSPPAADVIRDALTDYVRS